MELIFDENEYRLREDGVSRSLKIWWPKEVMVLDWIGGKSGEQVLNTINAYSHAGRMLFAGCAILKLYDLWQKPNTSKKKAEPEMTLPFIAIRRYVKGIGVKSTFGS
jgi:hypothetical protein